MAGRICFDMMQVIKKDHKLSSYSLNYVSAEFLNQQKEDVHHSMIAELHAKNQNTRKRLAEYCIKDAYLPLQLMDKLQCMFNYTEMARVTGVPLKYLFTRGQQIKVASQLYRKAFENEMIIPSIDRGNGGETFEGAIVIDPICGYYEKPIATLDFASLYPSIMMAHNLCYTTLVPRNRVDELDSKMYVRTPTGDCFVKEEYKKGLLPQILEDLISARK